MRVFRIDNRAYATNDLIEPQGEYQNALDAVRIRVEQILEDNRPEEKPVRDTILMVFEEFEDAKNHWTIQTNSKFYQSEIEQVDILHRGDYNKVEELYRSIDDVNAAGLIAQEYWNEEMTEDPKIEIFVESATVTVVKSNIEIERKNAFAIRLGQEPRRGVRIIINEI